MHPNGPNRHAPLRVLLVEDDGIFRSLGRTMLELLGFEVLDFACGNEAVAFARREKPDVGMVLSDYRMPGMDGVETLAALQELYPGLKVILCSGTPEEECFRGRVLENCIYLGKPFGFQDLDAAVNRLLG